MQLVIRALTLTVLAASPAAARAQAAAPPAAGRPALAVVAENRTAAAEATRGSKRGDAGVRAGDVVRYRLTFTNPAARPVRNVVLSNPVPSGLRFVPGSARAGRDDARAEYSADGGRTFSVRPVETVVVDGRQVERPVAPERYTNVRWTVVGLVAPRAAVTAEYDAQLATASPAAGAASGAK